MKTIEINGKNYEIKDGSCFACPSFRKSDNTCILNMATFCAKNIAITSHPELIIYEPDSWKKGDVLYKDNSNIIIREILGDIIFYSLKDSLSSVYPMMKFGMYDTGWRLKQDIVKEPTVTELTLEEVAKKFNIPVDELRIKEK